MKKLNIITALIALMLIEIFGIDTIENFVEKLNNFNWKIFWKVILVITTIIFFIQMTLLTFYHYSNLTFYLINGSLTITSSIILEFYKFKEK